MTAAALVQASDKSKVGWKGYGAAQRLWSSKAHEVVLSGPYETGKTLGCLHKINALLCKYPGARTLMVRRTLKSLMESAVITYERKVLAYPPSDARSPIEPYGGERPEFYSYPNGSRLILGGMDNPDKFLSAEFDFIYVNQAEELLLDHWEKLTGRATGRAGNAPYSQVLGDCNPGPPGHWLKQRDGLLMLESRHEDNPMLFDPDTGKITEQGKRSIAVLDAMTGIRYKRGRLGLWVAAEGQVYEYDPAIHLLDPFPIPDDWRRVRAVDFGYTNPFVCQWWAMDHDGRMYLYREIYMSQRTVRVHAEQINRLSEGENIEATVADHDAEDRATLAENGIHTVAAEKAITVGIEKVQERLKPAGDGKPRLFVLADALVEVDEILREKRKPYSTEQEFAGYVYPVAVDGKPIKEVPVDLDNHGMDGVRYGVMYLDQDTRLLMW